MPIRSFNSDTVVQTDLLNFWNEYKFVCSTIKLNMSSEKKFKKYSKGVFIN